MSPLIDGDWKTTCGVKTRLQGFPVGFCQPQGFRSFSLVMCQWVVRFHFVFRRFPCIQTTVIDKKEMSRYDQPRVHWNYIQGGAIGNKDEFVTLVFPKEVALCKVVPPASPILAHLA